MAKVDFKRMKSVVINYTYNKSVALFIISISLRLYHYNIIREL